MSTPDIDFLAEVDSEAVGEPQAEVVETVETPAEPAPVTPTVQEPQEERVPLAALKAEREKRQRYEAELQRLQQQAMQPQREPPDFYADPQEYVKQVISQERQGMQHLMMNALEAQARDAFPDYDEVLAEMQDQVRSNPVYQHQILSSPNPASAAYKLGLQLRQLREMQDPAAFRQKVEAELRQKLEAEFRAKEEARLKAVAAIPPDISANRSAKDSEAPPDDSLDAILQSRKR